MTRRIAPSSLLIALLLLAGCVPNLKTVMTLEGLYTAAANDVAAQVEAGKIKDVPTLQKIKVANDTANASLGQAKDAALAGRKFDLIDAIKSAEPAVEFLIRIKFTVERTPQP